MNDAPERLPEILVPIDLHGINSAVLNILVGIARNLNRELLGLILVDARLQQVATLPFTTEIVLGSGRERGLVPANIVRRQTRVAEDTRERLHELARRDQVRLKFDQAVGSRLESALTKSGHGDIFFPARRRWRSLPSVAKVSIPRLGLLLTGGEADEKGIQIVQALVQAGLAGRVYLLSNRDSPTATAPDLTPAHADMMSVIGDPMSPDFIVSLIRQSPYDLLILPRDCLGENPPGAVDLALDASPGQILLVS